MTLFLSFEPVERRLMDELMDKALPLTSPPAQNALDCSEGIMIITLHRSDLFQAYD
jgi:hypothetical protein